MFVPVCDRPSVAEPTEAQDRAVMETKSAAIHRKMLMLVSQLPITGSAHKAAVIGDPLMAAVLAGLDMTAQSRRAAMLDRRHDLELLKAQVSGMDSPISGSGGTEDVGDLERGAHRFSRWVRPLRPGTCRACRAGWSRYAPFGSRPWCGRRCCPASRARARPG